MELVKKQIHTNKIGKKIVDQFLVDDDFNVPDTKSDVQRVIGGKGTVKVEDVKMVENYIRVSGKLHFRILYATEGIEQTLESMKEKFRLRRWFMQKKAKMERLLYKIQG